MFLKEDGSVDQGKAYFSHQAAGVPGTVAGLIHAQKRFGKLTLKQVIQPAIDLAEKGFATPLALLLGCYPNFCDNPEDFQVDILRNQDLDTLLDLLDGFAGMVFDTGEHCHARHGAGSASA